jgi:hypothetical protein
MKTLRESYALVMILFLGSGYAASQFAWINGSAAEYALRVDVPTVSRLALLLLAAGAFLAFWPQTEATD